MDLVPRDGKPYYPCRHPSSYGTELFSREGLSRGGQFAQGFGAVPDEYRPALLWVYNHFVEPDESARTFDTVSPYPHRAVLAFVNWPVGVEPKGPAGVVPQARQDSLHRYFVFRNGWKDDNDVLVTALFGARNDGPEPVTVWGLGMRATVSVCPKQKVVSFESKPDGSGTVSVAGGTALAVDFSGASGAAALVVMIGPGANAGKDVSGKDGASIKATTVKAGGRIFSVLTVQKGPAPEAKADGDKVVVGGQTIAFDGEKITLAR
jgi:hypothetical protein